MDKVLAICKNYAVLEKGKPAYGGAYKELQALTDIKMNSDGYLEKQVKPYLERYGRRLAVDVRHMTLGMEEHGLPDEQLKRFGYYEFENERSGRCYLNRMGKEDNGTYVVAIRGGGADGGVDSGGWNLGGLHDAMLYVARIALLSKDGNGHGLPVTVQHDNAVSSTVSFNEVPLHLLYLPEFQDIHNVFKADDVGEPFATYGTIVKNAAKRSIDVRLYIDANAHRIERTANLQKLAASILLICLMRTYRFGSDKYAIDFATGGIVEQTPSNLIQSVLECVASGKVRECPHCARPIFGTRKFCRHGGCYQRMSEKAQAQLEVGLTLEDAIEKYGDYFSVKTIEGWANREGR